MSEYDRIPKETLGRLNNYVLHGVDPGSFLCACLRDRFVESASRADSCNAAALREIALYIYNRMPGGCWGNEKKITQWMDVGGLIGRGSSASVVDLHGPLE